MIEGQAVSARAASAASWLVGARLLTRGLDFVGLLILARLLAPADFGIVAIAMTLVLIAETVLELPLGQVLVTLPAIGRVHMDTAFTLSLLRGVAVAALIGLCAAPFAWLYRDTRLVPLICALGLAPALRGMGSPAMIHYARTLDFRRDFAIELAGKSATLIVATGMAFVTHSYWALALGTIAGPMAMTAMSYALAPFRPRLSLAGWSAFRGYLAFSSAAQFAAAISWQCDRLLLGRFVPHALLGAYSLANDLAYVPEQALIKPIVRPVASALTLIRDDPERLRLAYAKTATTVVLIGLPVMLGLSLLADPAVRLALGGKWLAAVPILMWLPLSLIPPLFGAPLPALAFTLGRPRLFLHLALAETATRLPLMAIGAWWGGVPGVIIARFASAVLTGGFVLHVVRTLIGVSSWQQLLWLRRVALAGAALAGVLLLLRPLLDGRTGLPLLFGLGGCAASAMIAYVAVLYLSWRMAGRPAGAEQALFETTARHVSKLVARR